MGSGRWVCAVGVVVLFGAGCAHEMGKNAVSGAAQTIAKGQAKTEDDPSQQITRVMSERAVAGAIAALDAPEQREKIRQVVNEAVQEAIGTAFRTATEVPKGAEAGLAGERGVSPIALLMAQAARAAIEDAIGGLVRDLGGGGEGPLANSLAGTGKNVSAAVVGGALDKLTAMFPGCRGPDAIDCIDHKIQGMSRSAAVGFTDGVRESIGWPVLVLFGLGGLALGLFAHWLWSLRPNARLLRTRTV